MPAPAGLSQDFPPELGEGLSVEFMSWLLTNTSELEARMRIEYLRIDRATTVLRMPVEGNTQYSGMLHGGASCVLAESASSLAACAYGWPSHMGYGTSLVARYHRPATSGFVTATTRLERATPRAVEYEVALSDDRGVFSEISVAVHLARRRLPGNRP